MIQFPPERYIIKVSKYVPKDNTTFDLEFFGAWYVTADDPTVTTAPAKLTDNRAEAAPFYKNRPYLQWVFVGNEIERLGNRDTKIQVIKLPFRDAIDDLMDGNL